MSDSFNYTLQQVETLCTNEFGWQGDVSPNGEFICYCPIHGDKNASLSVALKNGRILIRCWSHGCEKQVYQYVSQRGAWPQQLETKELADKANKAYEKKYPERAQSNYKWNSFVVTHDEAVRYSNKIRDTITLTDRAGAPTIFKKKSVHIYTDGQSAHSIVARYDAAGKKKRIFQYSYGYFDSHDDPSRPTDPNNPKWQIRGWSSDTVKHMIYGMTFIRSFDEATVIIVEGEKAADYGNTKIRSVYPDYVFTTWKGGAQAVGMTDWSPLEGRNVIIIPDADEPGVFAGNAVGEALQGVAKSTKVVDIMSTGVPEKWDIADYPDPKIKAPKFLDIVGGYQEDFVPDYGQDRSEEVHSDFITKRVIFPYRHDGSQRQDALEYFNERYGKLYEGGKLFVVDIKRIRQNPESSVIPEPIFHAANQHVKVQLVEKGQLKPASKFWLSNDHRSFERAVVNPAGKTFYTDETGKTCVNLWPGIAAEEMDQSGSCELFLEHLKFICSGEKDNGELHKFVLTFMARMIQQPNKRQGTILLLRGTQGSGKSIVSEYLHAMLGDKATLTVNKLGRITGQFNKQLVGKLLCRVEEAKIPKNEDYEILKDLAVNKRFTMEEKGKTQVTRENFVHFIFTGNYDYMAPVAERERRMVPIDVPDDKIDDTAYFNALVNEMEGLGPAALYKYLKEYPISENFLPIPQTKALSAQRSQTKSFSQEGFVLEWYSRSLKNRGLQTGPTGPSFRPWKENEEEDRTTFWLCFEAWLKEHSRNTLMTRRSFYKYFEEFQSGVGRLGRNIEKPTRGRFSSRYSGTQLLRFPNLRDAKDVFVEYVGDQDSYDVYGIEDGQDTLRGVA